MNKAVWFSRHSMTESQAAEIAAAGYEIFHDDKVSEMAKQNLASDEEVMEVIKYMQLLKNSGVRRFYGVFPAAIRSALLGMFGGNTLELWESWNVQRSPNGGKPTFEHKKFVLTYKG